MNGMEKKRRENLAKSSYIIDITDYDDNAKYLIGWPGYRTSKDKSGFGYLETQAELAHMEGLMLRWIFTGKFISHNPFYLFSICLFGLFVGVIPMIMLLGEILVEGNFALLFEFLPILPYMIVGIALFLNVIISLTNPDAKSITGD